MSVGGGSLEQNISPNIVLALQYAKSVQARITGVLGRDGGFAATVADVCVIIPTVNPETVTAHTEAFQAVVWHLLVTHPELRLIPGKWESVNTALGTELSPRMSEVIKITASPESPSTQGPTV
jgi:D-sedoheptulose 7-phosphate isomerase